MKDTYIVIIKADNAIKKGQEVEYYMRMDNQPVGTCIVLEDIKPNGYLFRFTQAKELKPRL